MKEKLPVYKIDLQRFFLTPIARVQHNGFGTAIEDSSGFVMGFLEIVGLRVLKLRQENSTFWVWALADSRYRGTETLIRFGQLVEEKEPTEK